MTRGRSSLIVAAVGAFVVSGTVGASAQIKLPPLVGTSPPPPPPGEARPAAPLIPLGPPPTAPPKPPPPPAAKPPPPAPPPALGGDPDGNIPADAGPFPANLAALSRSVKRTKPNNSRALVDALRALEGLGVPHDEAMRIGMGRFPIAGYANFVHDWWYPRFGPGWRLHQGTDLFADMGTPVRSPTDGAVRLSEGGLGGISTYVVQADGTYFYMAHLAGRPKGLSEGQNVHTGDIVGYVGNTGNAAGGPTHVHFEVHPAYRVVTKGRGKKATTQIVPLRVSPGTVLPAVDPKPWLDDALREALDKVPALVASFQGQAQAGLLPAGVPGATVPPLPGVSGPVAPRDLPLATARSVFLERPTTATPLAAVAFLLLVMMASLTPVLVPKYALPSTRAHRWPRRRRTPGGDGHAGAAGGHKRHRRKKKDEAIVATTEADRPEAPAAQPDAVEAADAETEVPQEVTAGEAKEGDAEDNPEEPVVGEPENGAARAAEADGSAKAANAKAKAAKAPTGEPKAAEAPTGKPKAAKANGTPKAPAGKTKAKANGAAKVTAGKAAAGAARAPAGKANGAAKAPAGKAKANGAAKVTAGKPAKTNGAAKPPAAKVGAATKGGDAPAPAGETEG